MSLGRDSRKTPVLALPLLRPKGAAYGPVPGMAGGAMTCSSKRAAGELFGMTYRRGKT